jgi:hypothetical protein
VAGAQQVGFQPPGQVAAVLQRERHLRLGPLRGPSDRLQVPVAGGGHGALGELAAHLVDGDQRAGALVGVHPDHDPPDPDPDHARSSHLTTASAGCCGRARRARVNRASGTLLSSHATAQHRSGGAAHRDKPPARWGNEEMSEPHRTEQDHGIKAKNVTGIATAFASNSGSISSFA